MIFGYHQGVEWGAAAEAGLPIPPLPRIVRVINVPIYPRIAKSILVDLDHYAREDDVTEGRKLRASPLVESIAYLHGIASLGAIQSLDLKDFEQYAR